MDELYTYQDISDGVSIRVMDNDVLIREYDDIVLLVNSGCARQLAWAILAITDRGRANG